MMSTELERLDNRQKALSDNSFGILDSDGTIEEKMLRLIALVPMALEIVDEARETIGRLRDENAELIHRLERNDPQGQNGTL